MTCPTFTASEGAALEAERYGPPHPKVQRTLRQGRKPMNSATLHTGSIVIDGHCDTLGDVLGGALRRFGEVQQAIETDGRPEKRRQIISAHSQILQ